jgi:hypothetical protein
MSHNPAQLELLIQAMVEVASQAEPGPDGRPTEATAADLDELADLAKRPRTLDALTRSVAADERERRKYPRGRS